MTHSHVLLFGTAQRYRCYGFQICTQNQIEAQRSGFDLERSRDKMSERRLLQKSRRERYDVRGDVSCVDKKDASTAEGQNRPSGRRRECAVNSEPPKAAENCAGAALPTPSIEITEGWSDQRERNPKRKTRLTSCLPFWTGRLKSIFFQQQTKPPRSGGTQPRAQRSTRKGQAASVRRQSRQRLRSGSRLEARSSRMSAR